MPAWEYLEFTIDYSHDEPRLTVVHAPTYRETRVDTGGADGDLALRHLDALGAEGWEVVAMGGTVDGMSYTLKRPKQ